MSDITKAALMFILGLLIGAGILYIPLNKQPKLPKLMGIYTTQEILWLNTETLEITGESGNYYHESFKDFSQAWDYMEELSADFTLIEQALPKDSYIVGNPENQECLVYCNCPYRVQDSIIGVLKVFIKSDDSTFTEKRYPYWEYKPL